MALNAPYLSCASCGIRNHGNYAEIDVTTLPDFFKFNAKHQAMFDVLKGKVSLCCCRKLTLNLNRFAEGVFLMDESGVLKETATDLSPVMSSCLSETGTRYHLHPELVKTGETTEMCCLCVPCLHLVKEEIATYDIRTLKMLVPQSTLIFIVGPPF